MVEVFFWTLRVHFNKLAAALCCVVGMFLTAYTHSLLATLFFIASLIASYFVRAYYIFYPKEEIYSLLGTWDLFSLAKKASIEREAKEKNDNK